MMWTSSSLSELAEILNLPDHYPLTPSYPGLSPQNTKPMLFTLFMAKFIVKQRAKHGYINFGDGYVGQNADGLGAQHWVAQ